MEDLGQIDAGNQGQTIPPAVRETAGYQGDMSADAIVLAARNVVSAPVMQDKVTDDELDEAWIQWVATPVADRKERNATELSARIGCDVSRVVHLQKLAVAEWIATKAINRQPPLQKDLAALIGVYSQHVSRWMRSRDFAVLDIRACMRAALLESLGDVVDNMKAQASSPMGGAPEMKLYLDTVELSTPKNPDVVVQQNNVYAAAPSEKLDAVPAIDIVPESVE